MKPREITFSWFTLFRVTCFDFPPSHKVFAVAFFLQSLVNLIKRRGDHLQYGDCVISRLRPDTECHFVLIIGLFFVVFRVFFWSIFFVLEDYLSKSNAHLYIIDCVHTNILVHDSQSWEKKQQQQQHQNENVAMSSLDDHFEHFPYGVSLLFIKCIWSFLSSLLSELLLQLLLLLF